MAFYIQTIGFLGCVLLLLLITKTFGFQNGGSRNDFSPPRNVLFDTTRKRWKMPSLLHDNFQSPSSLPKMRRLKVPSVVKKRLGRLLFVAVPFLFLATFGGAARAASTVGSHHPAMLGVKHILLAGGLMATLAILPLSLGGMGFLSKSLAVSAARCAVQVSLLGSVVLQKMMGVSNPLYVVVWVFGVGIIAGRESIARIQYTYPLMKRNMYLSVLTGGLAVLGFTLWMQLLGNFQPWYDPRTWISIAGMLFGNTLNASALGAATITKQFAIQADASELRLLRGATLQQAVRPLIEESYRTALTPTINGLAATGIVHIPGMMTGQILAGQSPQQASMYQIMINFLIATVATFTCHLVVKSSVAALVDTERSCLTTDTLMPKRSNESSHGQGWKRILHLLRPSFSSSIQNTQSDNIGNVVSTSYSRITGKNAVSVPRQPVMEVLNLSVPRAGVHIDKLFVDHGDRIAITGKSGIGKSQLLRTIVGLEESTEKFEVFLLGEKVTAQRIPEFRRKSVLVTQNAPNLEGTPRLFCQEIQKYGATLGSQNGDSQYEALSVDLASKWGLSEDSFDMPWSTLSGGQAQRASLAIAMSLKPDVLLLDEALNALDEETSILVEDSLIKSGIPILMSTHSKKQLQRFCTHQINIEQTMSMDKIRRDV